MSNRDFAKSLIDQIPESKLLYVVAYLQGAGAFFVLTSIVSAL